MKEIGRITIVFSLTDEDYRIADDAVLDEHCELIEAIEEKMKSLADGDCIGSDLEPSTMAWGMAL